LGGSVPKRVKLYEIKEKLLQNLKEWKSWELRFNVDSLYLSYLAVSAQLKALKSYKKSLERLKETTALGIKRGKFAQVDLLKVESSIGEVEAKVARLRSQLLYFKEALSTLVGRPVLELEPVPVSYSPLSLSLKRLYRELLKKNHLLKSKKEQIQASSQEVKLVKSKYGPRLLVEGNYLRNYGFDSGENEGIGEISVKLSVPIFEFGRRKLELLSARLKKLSTLQEYRSAQLSLKRELAEAVSRLNALQGQIAGYQKELRYSKEVARIELLNAKVKLDAANIERTKAKNKYDIALRAFHTITATKMQPVFTMGVFGITQTQKEYKEQTTRNYKALDMFDAKAKQSASLVKIKEAAYLPDVMAYGNVNLYKDTSPIMESLPKWFAGVVVKIDILQRKNRDQEIALAKITHKKVHYLKEEAVENLKLLVEKTYKEMVAFSQEYRELDSSLALAKENCKLRRLSFKEGLATSSDVVDAELFLESIKTKRLHAAYNFLLCLSRLSVLSGEREKFFTFLQHAGFEK
jgi:outer membrane protein TolC